MSLLDEMKTQCVRMETTRVPDGEGGSYAAWTEGERFLAALVLDTSTQAVIAEKQGVTAMYTVTSDVPLGHHAAFKRLSDGQTFRVVSDEREPPDRATFRFYQSSAERWELPT